MLRNTRIFILLFLLAFTACKTHYNVSKKEAQHQGLKDVPASAKFDSIISPYKKQLAGEMGKQLVLCTDDLTKEGDEMTLGNFACDAIKWSYDSLMTSKTNALVLVNRGGLRANINKGIISVNSIFELMPFDNELEAVTVNGKELEEVIKLIIQKKHAFLGMTIHVTKDGHAVVIDGKTLQPDANYTLVTSDFLVNGGDGFTFGKTAISSKKLNIKIRDAMIYYCMHLKYTGKTISPYRDGRFEISK